MRIPVTRELIIREFPMMLAVCFIAVILGGLGSIGWLFTFEQPYLEYKNVPFPVLIQPVKPGQAVPLTISRCSRAHTPRTYTVSHSLENVVTHQITLMPETQAFIHPGCATGPSDLHVIPLHTAPGRYRVYGMAEIHTSFRTHYVEWYSQEFDVVGN